MSGKKTSVASGNSFFPVFNIDLPTPRLMPATKQVTTVAGRKRIAKRFADNKASLVEEAKSARAAEEVCAYSLELANRPRLETPTSVTKRKA
jgi:hypothetical protein